MRPVDPLASIEPEAEAIVPGELGRRDGLRRCRRPGDCASSTAPRHRGRVSSALHRNAVNGTATEGGVPDWRGSGVRTRTRVRTSRPRSPARSEPTSAGRVAFGGSTALRRRHGGTPASAYRARRYGSGARGASAEESSYCRRFLRAGGTAGASSSRRRRRLPDFGRSERSSVGRASNGRSRAERATGASAVVRELPRDRIGFRSGRRLPTRRRRSRPHRPARWTTRVSRRRACVCTRAPDRSRR